MWYLTASEFYFRNSHLYFHSPYLCLIFLLNFLIIRGSFFFSLLFHSTLLHASSLSSILASPLYFSFLSLHTQSEQFLTPQNILSFSVMTVADPLVGVAWVYVSSVSRVACCCCCYNGWFSPPWQVLGIEPSGVSCSIRRHSIFGQVIQTKNWPRDLKVQLHCRSNGPGWYLQNILCNRCRAFTLLN